MTIRQEKQIMFEALLCNNYDAIKLAEKYLVDPEEVFSILQNVRQYVFEEKLEKERKRRRKRRAKRVE